MTDLDRLARDDEYIKVEVSHAWEMMGQKGCDYPSIIHGLGVLLMRCRESMVPRLQATLLEATKRQSYEIAHPRCGGY